MSGSRAIGRHASPIGSGCRLRMPGPRAAGSTCPAIGIIPWPAGGWSFRRFISPGRWPSTIRRFAWTWARSASRSSARPAYGHYYFGDYYDDRYVVLGIRPWYYNAPRYGYDPLFTYYRWYHVEHMHEAEWDVHLVGWHDYYRTHPEMRPPHTLVEERRLLATREGMARPDLQQLHMARDIHEAAERDSFVRLQAVSPAERAQIHQAARGDGSLYGRAPATRTESGRRSPAQRREGEPDANVDLQVGIASGPATPAVSRPAGTAAATGRPVTGAPAVGRPAAGTAAGVPPASAPGRGPATGPAARTAATRTKTRTSDSAFPQYRRTVSWLVNVEVSLEAAGVGCYLDYLDALQEPPWGLTLCYPVSPQGVTRTRNSQPFLWL